VPSIGLSADGTLLVSGSLDHTMRVWDVPGRKALSPPLEAKLASGVIAVAIAPDGTTVAAAVTGDAKTEPTVHLWDVPSRQARPEPLRQGVRINALAFTPDGQALLTAGADKLVRLWNLRTNKAEFQLTGHTGAVNSIALSGDGAVLATGGDDGTVRLWFRETE
jgi:WD40 repeat protein